MNPSFDLSEFLSRYSTEDVCLEEIRKIRFPNGVTCIKCRKQTKHYKVKGRTAFVCKYCRNHLYPLAGTIFEKTTTPLRLWFFAIFLMIHTRSNISAKQLQRELGVTYKTAWRMYKQIRILMEQNNGDLLKNPVAVNKLLKWTFFNKIELKVVEKKATSEM